MKDKGRKEVVKVRLAKQWPQDHEGGLEVISCVFNKW